MKRAVVTVLLCFAVALVVAPVGARPGGGQNYSSPSPSPRSYPSPASPSPRPWSSPSPSPRSSPWSSPSPSPRSGSSDYDYTPSPGSSYSGGGGGGGGAASLFFMLLFVGVVVVVTVVKHVVDRQREDWATNMGSTFVAPDLSWSPPPPPPPKPTEPPGRDKLLELTQVHDPEFSLVVFEDFLYSLFAAFHEARGKSARHDVTPYVESEAKNELLKKKDDVRSVIVGSMEITKARAAGNRLAVEVTFEANYEEVERGVVRAFYASEKWVLQRALTAKSRAPDKASLDDCPNCGASLADLDGNVCRYCKEALTPGRFDWAVTHITAERSTRGPMLGGADTVEVGTDRPTIVRPGAEKRYAQLCERDPSFSWPGFQERVKVIFAALHEGWNARDWRPVRPYVSDQLFQSQLYWIEEYKKQRLVNHTDGARVASMTMSNVESDKHFDSLTVRVFATGKDYTVHEEGRLVSGNRHVDREYSEYWTLIRGRGAAGSTKSDAGCPNCGAALSINMAGACEHCQVKVTRGQFDWVLSRIEQD
jgi:hypothetical protein